jgi:hypothetical protein
MAADGKPTSPPGEILAAAQFDQDDHHHSFLYDFTSLQDPEISAALLDALGLPSSSLVANPDPESSVKYRLVLGDDYEPCFNPANFLH